MSIYTQGVHGSGSRDYEPEHVARVVAALKDGCTSVAAVSERTGIAGRTVRNIVSDYDGVEFLLGGSGNGYQLADGRDDAERLTRRFESQVNHMADRIARRWRYLAAQERSQ